MQNLFKLTSLFILLFFNFGCKIKAQNQNIALHKPYNLSYPPNYKGSAPATDKISLTDGVTFSGKNFVRQKTVLGWQSRSQIAITINLEKVQIVKSVGFNTFQNLNVGIKEPSDMFVFLSEDDSNFTYVGNAVSNTSETLLDRNKPKLILNNINQKAQYIILVVIPSGKFVFCDEIEVGQGNEIDTVNKKMVSKENITELTDSLIKINYTKNQILTELDEAAKSKYYNSELNEKSISVLKSQIENSNITGNFLDSTKSKLNKYHADKLKQKFNASYIVESYNPWDTLSQYHFPKGQQKLSYDFIMPEKGTEYGAFVITNITDLTEKFTFKIQSLKTGVAEIELLNAPFIQSVNYKMIPDPLVPVTPDGISIEPGNSTLIIFKIKGIGKGNVQPVISVIGKEKSINIASNIQIVALNGFGDDFELNANVWAYFNFTMLQDRKKEAAIDLQNHHINTIVIPASVLPKIGDTDIKQLNSYLENARFAKKILVAPQFKSVNNRSSLKGGQFLSQKWKSSFLNWQKIIWQTIRSYGFTDSQIYLYPYDEVRDSDISDDVVLINWLKKQVPGIKIYGTLLSTNKEAINAVLPLLDIAQIQLKGKNFNTVTDTSNKPEIWFYKNSPLSSSESPYSFYRLMAWEAFFNDYKGIGFWTYASNKKQKFISDPFVDADADYAAIYNGDKNSIISSRRWDAFSLGIEDYQVLYLYSKNFGLKKAKEFAKEVIGNPDNTNLANEARDTMIKALEK